MFAIIQTGGKQYKVNTGTYLSVEKLDFDVGADVIIDNVILLNDGNNVIVGNPIIQGAKVACTVVAQKRNKKVIIFKKSRRKNYRRKNGHRQHMTVLMVKDILH